MMKRYVLVLLAVLFLAACGRSSERDVPEDGPIIPIQGGMTPGGQNVPPTNGETQPVVLPPREAAPITMPDMPAQLGAIPDMRYELIIPIEHGYISAFRYGVARMVDFFNYTWSGQTFRVSATSGLINLNGESVIDVDGEVLQVGEVYNHITWVVFDCAAGLGHRTVIINTDGQVLHELPPGRRINSHVRGYDMLVVFEHNFETNTARFGVITTMGHEIIPLDYHTLIGFNEGRGILMVSPEGSPHLNRFGFIDVAGNVLVTPHFHDARPFMHGVAAVTSTRMTDGARWELIDMNGDALTPARFTHIGAFHGGLARVITIGPRPFSFEQGFINSLGEMVIPTTEMDARNFSEGMAAFEYTFFVEDGFYRRWGFMDASGMIIVAPQFYQVRDFSGGMAAVAVRGSDGQLRWGFVNTLGELVVPTNYTWVSCFTADGFTAVNRYGDLFPMEMEFDEVIEMGNSTLVRGGRTWQGVAGGQFYIIDTWGRMVMQLHDYCAVGQISGGLLAVNQGRVVEGTGDDALVTDEGLWGVIRLVK